MRGASDRILRRLASRYDGDNTAVAVNDLTDVGCVVHALRHFGEAVTAYGEKQED